MKLPELLISYLFYHPPTPTPNTLNPAICHLIFTLLYLSAFIFIVSEVFKVQRFALLINITTI